MRHLAIKAFAAISLVGASAPYAAAQEITANQADEQVPPQETDRRKKPDIGASQGDIVVTGSLIRGLPKEYVASPVFTYGQADIVHSGAGSVSEYMLTIPQNFTGDLSEFATTGAGIGSPLGDAATYNQFDGFAGFALRGLASDATLTLLNGRRMPSVGLTEAPTVSTIPSMLIERIDIIPDGASATYGADAVAGVVNIVTRKPDHGLELQARGATATRTGKEDVQISGLAGHSWGSGTIYGMAMYQKRSPFIGDPVDVSGEALQITQLPNERLSGLYAGGRQEAGDFTFSIDASRFQRDRNSRQIFLDEPAFNREFKTRTTGVSVYNGIHWQGKDSTALDLTMDYHRTHTDSSSSRVGRSPSLRDSTNTLFVAELRGQTALATLPAGPILVAGGFQYRAETLRTDATIFFNRNGGTRKVKSVFGEVNLPIVGTEQGVPLIRSLILSAAARYEDLGFDRTLSPKIGLRWQIDRSIALRGTYARSFLVPRFRSTIGIAEQVSFGLYDYKFLDPKNQNPALPAGKALVMFRAGANPDLKTQKADTFTVGVDFTPTFIPDLTVKAGYYRIRISGRVGTPSPDDSLSVKDLQVFNTLNPSLAQVKQVIDNPAVFRRFAEVPSINGGDLTFFDNAGQVPASLLSRVQLIADIRAQNFAVESTDGLDLDLAYRTTLFGGTAMVNLTGQYILNLDLKAGGSTAISRLDGYAKPADLRLNGTIAWGRGAFSIGSVVNYVDGFTDDRPNEPVRNIGSYTTASLFLGVDLRRLLVSPLFSGSEAQLVVANLFDRQPPRVVNGVVGYDPYNNPPNPRTVGLVLSKRF
ncbi:MAG: TonB-dependent receptor [Candidatus Sphingomonas phytovorans]|nr:TonB-dependent receptor [Sphingomonas sp.]WEK00153.1 MAG: TonB-dependent receptor [Sphingomonas sp.]